MYFHGELTGWNGKTKARKIAKIRANSGTFPLGGIRFSLHVSTHSSSRNPRKTRQLDERNERPSDQTVREGARVRDAVAVGNLSPALGALPGGTESF